MIDVLIRRLFIVAVFVFAPTASGEKYFTWVDERGQVHNQLIPDEAETEESFMDSEQLERQGFNRIEGERPFFVWVDSLGVARQTFYPSNTEEAASKEAEVFRFSGVPFLLQNCCAFLEKSKTTKLQSKVDELVSFTAISRHLPFSSGRSPFALLEVGAGKAIRVKSFTKDNAVFNPVAVFLDADFKFVDGRQFWLTDFIESGGFYDQHYRGAIEIPENSHYVLLITTDDLMGSASSNGEQLIRHSYQGKLVVRLAD